MLLSRKFLPASEYWIQKGCGWRKLIFSFSSYHKGNREIKINFKKSILLWRRNWFVISKETQLNNIQINTNSADESLQDPEKVLSFIIIMHVAQSGN